MAKKKETREQRVYKQLASCGRYHDTGKVLIGLQYQPKNHNLMGPDEELVQRILLGERFSILAQMRTLYVVGMIVVLILSTVEERIK